MKTFFNTILSLGVLSVLFVGYVHADNNKILVTVSPTTVYCDAYKNSECLLLTLLDSSISFKTKSIAGFDFKKGNTYVIEVTTIKQSGYIPTVYILENIISRSFNSNVCTNSTYNDGCNECVVGTNGQTSCSKMICEQSGIPFCNHDEPISIDTICATEANPNCLSNSALRLDNIQWAYKNGITQFNIEKSFMGDNKILRVHAAKMFTAFATLYSNNTINNILTSTQCLFIDTNYISSDLQGHIAQACTFGLLQGYNKKFMPNEYLLRSHAKIVLNRLIDNNDRNTLLTLNESFANKNMESVITRIELITIMHSIYEAHQVSLDLRIIRGTVTQYDTSPTTYDGNIVFSLDGSIYDIGGGMKTQPIYDTSMTVVYKDQTLVGTLSQYSSYIGIGDQMKISLPKGSHNLYDCKECQITLIKQ